MRIWWTFLYPTPPNYEIRVFRFVRKLRRGEGGGQFNGKQLLRKKNRQKKKLTSTYIFVSAFRLNLCFRPISFAKTNMVTDYWTSMSHVLSSHFEGVEGDTRVSPFKVFITRNLLMMLMKCVLVFRSGVLGHLLLSALNITHPSLLKCRNEFRKRTAFGVTEWEVTAYQYIFPNYSNLI